MAKSTVIQNTKINEQDLIAALNHLFVNEKWEIPDDAVSGKVSAQVAQLQSRVDHLTDELAKVTASKTSPAPRARVDALSAVDKKGRK